ncbi:MAG TPA: TIGR01777 family oxidoreductase [Gemmatimonadales bacterium]|nr:TIGR01777 family oxidoreductase [Gemmatimonadales bacterium]
MASSFEREGPGFHIAMTGGSGLIGAALMHYLIPDPHHRITRLVRRKAGPGEITWDPVGGRLDPAALEGIDAVIHLAGENVGARWTQSRKRRIRESRVSGTTLLGETIARLRRPPRVLISASAVGIYGNRGDETLTEASSLGDPSSNFLVSVCQEWEAAADAARAAGVRVVHPRFGVVLSPSGGALRKMLLPFRLGLGAQLGRGTQWLSWISIDDAVGAIHHALKTDGLSGPVNATAPNPVTNRDFTRTLGRVLRRPAPFTVPAAALRLALGEMAEETLLASARVLPAGLLRSQYQFRHLDLESALRHVLGKQPGSKFPA